MANIGINIRIDVTKIDKSRLFEGKKGTYLDLTAFINTDNSDQYGNHGFISQSTTKEERVQGVQTDILGNVKVFYRGDSQPIPQSQSNEIRTNTDGSAFDPDRDIPFMRLTHEYIY